MTTARTVNDYHERPIMPEKSDEMTLKSMGKTVFQTNIWQE